MQKATKESLNKKTNPVVQNVISSVGGLTMRLKLKELAEDRGLTQMDVVRLTGIGQNMINGFWNNRAGVKIGYAHIYSIMVALRVTDISDLMEVSMPKEVIEQFDHEADIWVKDKKMPSSVQKLLKDNESLSK